MIYELADDCRTSLTATAIRYAELTSDAIAVIVSTGGTIDYCILSDAMKTLPNLAWLKKGSPVPDRTGAAVLAASVLAGESLDDEIAVRDWLGGTSRAKAREQVVGLGRYGKKLTVLSSDAIGQDHVVDEADEEEELIRSWTPHFKR